MARPKKQEDSKLTDAELQIMNLLWQGGSGSVHQVLENLNQSTGKTFAYTTVSTLLRILEKKEFVTTVKGEGRGFLYQPQISQSEYQAKATTELVETVYSGQVLALVKNLLGHRKLDLEELKEIQKIIELESKS